MVNLARLAPGGESALLHTQSRQDGMIPVHEGEPTPVTETDETVLGPGMCVGFPAGGSAHHLVNRTWQDVVILEIGDRPAGDAATYPRDDLRAVMGEKGMWQFTHKDGTRYLGSVAAD